MDKFSDQKSGLEAPAAAADAVVPADGADLAQVTRGIYTGSGGDLAVIMADGSEVTFVNLAGGVVHPLRIARVKATGTTALYIVALY